MLEKLIQAQAW